MIDIQNIECKIKQVYISNRELFGPDSTARALHKHCKQQLLGHWGRRKHQILHQVYIFLIGVNF